MDTIIDLFRTTARADRAAIGVTRVGLVVALAWIGGLKLLNPGDGGVAPFAAKSPFLGSVYRQPAGEPRQQRDWEDASAPANREPYARSMKTNKHDTALVIIDPQNDVLSEKGVSWGLVGDSVKENHTIANIERLFKAAKEH